MGVEAAFGEPAAARDVVHPGCGKAPLGEFDQRGVQNLQHTPLGGQALSQRHDGRGRA